VNLEFGPRLRFPAGSAAQKGSHNGAG